MLERLIPYVVALALSVFLALIIGAFRWRYLRYVRRTIYAPQSAEPFDLHESTARVGAPSIRILWTDAAAAAGRPVPHRLVEARHESAKMRAAFAAAGVVYILGSAALVWYGARAKQFSLNAAAWLAYASTLAGVVLIVAFAGHGWRRWFAAATGWLAVGFALLVLGMHIKPSTAVGVIAAGLEYATLPLLVIAPLALRINRPLIVGFVPMVGLYLVSTAAVGFLVQQFGLSFAGHYTLPVVAGGFASAVTGIAMTVRQIRRGIRPAFVLLLVAMLGVGVLGLVRRFDSGLDYVPATIGGLGFNGLLTLTTWALFSQFLKLKARGGLTDEILHYSFCWLVLTALLPMMAQMEWNAVPFAVLIFGLYAAVLLLLLRELERRRPPRPPERMLFLRVFDQEPVRNRLLDILDDSWRRRGRLDLIVGADLALRSLGARALEGFLLGRARGRVLMTVHDADRRVARLTWQRMIDGRFPINELHCAPDVWPHVVSTLATRADVVLMDLRGWRTSHRGATFELSLVLQHVPLGRIVLLADRHTDEALLTKALGLTWSGLSASSINAALAEPCLEVVRCSGEPRTDARAIGISVSAAAESAIPQLAVATPGAPA